MLCVSHLTVSVNGHVVLQDVSLDCDFGRVTALLGVNGSGKSSLALTIMGHPRYQVDCGTITLFGQDITHLPPHARAALGLFLSLQSIPEIPGVRFGEYLRLIHGEYLKRENPEAKALSPFIFKRFVAPILAEFGLDATILERDLNTGFSGGEKRRAEMLQMQILMPKFVILDELDSGLDAASRTLVVQLVQSIIARGGGVAIISHDPTLLQDVRPSQVHILARGQLNETGDARLLARMQAYMTTDTVWVPA